MALKYAFIISSQRSGSNWLHRCLNHHPAVAINGELHPCSALVHLDKIRAGDEVAQARLEKAESFHRLSSNYIKQLMLENTDGVDESTRLLIDKSAYQSILPTHKNREQSSYASLTNNYFPNEKKILLIRDVKDVIVSFSEWKKQPLGSLLSYYPKSLMYFYRHLKNWCELHEQWLRDAQGDDWLVISYQDMKDNFEQTLVKVFGFLELEADEKFLEDVKNTFYSIDSPIYMQENQQRGYSFFRKGRVGEWQEKFNPLHKILYKLCYRDRVDRILNQARLDLGI